MLSRAPEAPRQGEEGSRRHLLLLYLLLYLLLLLLRPSFRPPFRPSFRPSFRPPPHHVRGGAARHVRAVCVRATACVRASVIVCVVREGKGRKEGREGAYGSQRGHTAAHHPARLGREGLMAHTQLLGEIRFFPRYIRILTASGARS